MTSGGRPVARKIIEPQSGVGGCAPMPMKEREARERIAPDEAIEAATVKGLTMLGRMCRPTMRRREAPSTVAAVT